MRLPMALVAIAGLIAGSSLLHAQTGYQAERLAPDPVLKTPATPESMLMRAGYEQRHRDCLDAGLHIDAVLESNPEWAGALALRLYCEREEKRRVDEEADLTKLIQLQPTWWRWWAWRAKVREENVDRDGAMADTTEAIRLRPWDAELYRRRSYLKEDRRDYAAAFGDLKIVHQLLPEQAEPLRALAARAVLYGRSEAEAEQFGALAEVADPTVKDPKRKDEDLYTDEMGPEELMLRVSYAETLQKWRLALRLLNAALEVKPGLRRGWEMRIALGMAHPGLTTYAMYHRRASDAYSRNPKKRKRQEEEDRRLERNLTLGVDPLRDVRELIELEPGRADYYRLRIRLLKPLAISRANMPRAEWEGQLWKDYAKLVELEPYEQRNYAEFAEFEMTQNAAEDAVKDYLLAIDLDPSNAQYSYRLSRAYDMQRLAAKRILSLNLALVGEPENAVWVRERAMLP